MSEDGDERFIKKKNNLIRWLRDQRPSPGYVWRKVRRARAVVGKGAPVEERSFAETLSDAARYETSTEEEEEEETLHRPSAPVPGPSMPRDLVTRAAIEQTVKMKQVRACNITAQFSDLLLIYCSVA